MDRIAKDHILQVSYWKPRRHSVGVLRQLHLDAQPWICTESCWMRSVTTGEHLQPLRQVEHGPPVHLKAAGTYWLPWAGLKVSGKFGGSPALLDTLLP